MIRMPTGHTREFVPCLTITRFCVPTHRTPLTGIGSGNLYHLAARIAQHLIQLTQPVRSIPRLRPDFCLTFVPKLSIVPLAERIIALIFRSSSITVEEQLAIL